MNTERTVTGAGNFWRGTGAVAATYAYFLLFAEFAFLELARAGLPGEPALRTVMGALGAGGIAGSVGALWRLGPEGWARRLAWSYAACAGVAAVAPFATGAREIAVVAVGIGLAVGWNTVTLAAGLRGWLPEGRLGWGAGLGTGLAYALCNVPAVFEASARVQAWLSVAFAAVAIPLVRDVRPLPRAALHPVASRWSTARWIAAFFALVSLDSAVFSLLQRTPVLGEVKWPGEVHSWFHAFMHLGAALVAGWLLDRGWLRGIVGGAWLALAVACFGLAAVIPVPAPTVIYAGGVSAYSAALVYLAARERPVVAAAVFAVAGWMGSAVGVGVAQDLREIPWLWVWASGATIGLALWPTLRSKPLAPTG